MSGVYETTRFLVSFFQGMTVNDTDYMKEYGDTIW